MTNEGVKGFTLIEILVVLAIIGVLSSIVLSRMNEARNRAQIAKAEGTVKQIRIAIAIMEGDTLEWPGHKTIDDIQNGVSGNEIWDLNSADSGLVATDGLFLNWNGPYIPTIPMDPWGNPYFFDTDYDLDPPNGDWAAVIGSFGPNGIGQNTYDSDNIIEVIVSGS